MHERFLRGAAFLALLFAAGAAPAEEGEASGLGERIFREGRAERELVARLGHQGTEVPASMLPCKSCHGEDGRGRAEGGLSPADITWPALRSWRETGTRGRRPPYNPELLVRAITEGLDSGGRPLDAAMPLYDLEPGEAAALLSYLEALHRRRDPGISADAVRLGALLPRDSGATAALLRAAAREVEAGGGIFGRRIEWEFIEMSPGPSSEIETLEAALAAGEPFALLAPRLAIPPEPLEEILTRRQIPLVASWHPASSREIARSSHLFHTGPSPMTLARLLARHAGCGRSIPGRALILHARDREGEGKALEEELTRMRPPWGEVLRESVGESEDFGTLLKSVGAQNTDALFFLAPVAWVDDVSSVLVEGVRRPRVFFLGTRGWDPRRIPDPLRGQFQGLFPALPGDVSPAGFQRLRRLLGKAGMAELQPVALEALVSFDLLVHALEAAGRDLRRARVLEVLEALESLETGLAPPISFGPNRHEGRRGAWLVAGMEDPAGLLRDATWVEWDHPCGGNP